MTRDGSLLASRASRPCDEQADEEDGQGPDYDRHVGVERAAEKLELSLKEARLRQRRRGDDEYSHHHPRIRRGIRRSPGYESEVKESQNPSG